MPFSTGSFTCATDLLQRLNTHLVANSWTKLRGEADQVPVSPKTARYWRVVVVETPLTTTDFRELELLHLRATSGGANIATVGANWSFSSLGSGAGSDLVSGTGTVRSLDIDDQTWWAQYDFGVGTIVREISMKCDTADEAPRDFYVQWSHDAETWTTMFTASAQSWIDDETKVFTFDGVFNDPRHPSTTQARRSGRSLVPASAFNTLNKHTEQCDNIYQWQGPGYDANRRVFVSAVEYSDDVSGTDMLLLSPSTEYVATASLAGYIEEQIGNPQDAALGPQYLMMSSGGGTYWIYSNSIRVIIVCKTGTDDYTMAYVGFLAAFALPADWPFPLYIGATTADVDDDFTDLGAHIRDGADPGAFEAAAVRKWDGVWTQVGNHENATTINDPAQNPAGWTWPFHTGSSSTGGSFPNNTIGAHTTFDTHWLDHIDPTDQGDLPFIPVIVMTQTDGNTGALDGIFCVPGGAVLSAEQIITISAQNYRVFTTRDKSSGMNFYAIRED